MTVDPDILAMEVASWTIEDFIADDEEDEDEEGLLTVAEANTLTMADQLTLGRRFLRALGDRPREAMEAAIEEWRQERVRDAT